MAWLIPSRVKLQTNIFLFFRAKSDILRLHIMANVVFILIFVLSLSDGKMKGKVKYNVIGWYGPARGNAEFFLQEFKQSEMDKHECTTSITSCCCLPKGDVKMEALFLKDALYIGEE